MFLVVFANAQDVSPPERSQDVHTGDLLLGVSGEEPLSHSVPVVNEQLEC
jgi:hypothetical protein